MIISLDQIVNTYKINITGVIHVGAHTGEEIPYYKKYTSNIHVFEPRIEAFNRIPSDVNKYQYALGKRKRRAIMNISNNEMSSSFLLPKEHLNSHPEVSFSEKRIVSVRTLDSFNITNCSLLNMDVQGYELEVLKGGKETLKVINAIYTEVNTKEMYEGCVMIEVLDRWLFNYGFLRVHQVIHESWGWGDALYIKNK